MVERDILPKDTVLFDVQVAWDVSTCQKFDYEMPVRMPYPKMFMEWDMRDRELTDEEKDELRRELYDSLNLSPEQDPMRLDKAEFTIASAGALIYERQDGFLVVPSMLDANGDFIPMGIGGLVGLSDRNTVTEFSYIDLMNGNYDRYVKPGVDPQLVIEELKPVARSSARVCMTALGIIGCRNVETKELGKITMRRSGAEKRQGVPPKEIRYQTIILPGGGSRQAGKGRGKHHRASPLHRVRGHTKTYTAEAPLMGRHVGTYWWGWQIRGNADNGEIISDYKLAE
jgi:hypothetical protein